MLQVSGVGHGPKQNVPDSNESLGTFRSNSPPPESLLNHTLSTGAASVNSTIEPVTVGLCNPVSRQNSKRTFKCAR